MRYPFLIILCLLSLVSAGPISAACATGLTGCVDSPALAQNGVVSASDCDMGQADQGQSKPHKCNHDACCGYQLIAGPETGGVAMSPPLRTAAIAAVTKQLSGTGRETLLDPPRA